MTMPSTCPPELASPTQETDVYGRFRSIFIFIGSWVNAVINGRACTGRWSVLRRNGLLGSRHRAIQKGRESQACEIGPASLRKIRK